MSSEKMNVQERINYLRGLDANDMPDRGWSVPTAAGLDWLSTSFEEYFPDDVQVTYLYNSFEGGVRAEWSLNGTHAEVQFDLVNHTAVWHAHRMSGEKCDTRTLDLSTADDWSWLVSRVRTIGGR